MEREEYAIVLEFLPNGYPMDTTPSHRKTSIAQVMGINRFTLLEVVPKKDVHLNLLDKIYIGSGKRNHIHHVNGKLPFNKLTHTGRSNIEPIITKLVHTNQERFIDFFNKSQPLSTRMHAIELLPGVGKKHMWEILDERKEGLFKNFDDIKKRISLLPNPEHLVIKRIIKELSGEEKHLLFVDK